MSKGSAVASSDTGVSTVAAPVVLVGDTRKTSFLVRIRANGWGRMCLRDLPAPYDGEPWGFDNGAFGAWSLGEPFPTDLFSRRLGRAHTVGTPYLAVTPDLVAGGEESLEFSLRWREVLPNDWPWYLAVQDGMTPERVTAALPGFAGVFLGGSTKFKATAMTWRDVAHRAGLPFHYGRAGVPRKIRHAITSCADSLDSAFPLWSEERFSAFEACILGGDPQMQLRLDCGRL
jgi:hypothetical protein